MNDTGSVQFLKRIRGLLYHCGYAVLSPVFYGAQTVRHGIAV